MVSVIKTIKKNYINILLKELDREGCFLNSLGRAHLTEKVTLEILNGVENMSPGKSKQWKNISARENNQCIGSKE